MDNAATTMIRPEVLEEMLPFLKGDFANPASHYKFSASPFEAVNQARRKAAKVLNADEKEIYFTSGGTEADNWAIRGIAEAHAHKGKHIISTAFEHHALLHSCKSLEKKGFEVTYLRPDEKGYISAADVEKAIRPDTILISVIFANNEIGTIQPIEEIGAAARKHNIVFHTDAVQAVGHIPVDVKKMNIDLLSLSAHKFYGPKGAGALYIRKGVKIAPLFYGGMQELNKRAGTHNVPGIVGLGKAIELAWSEMDQEAVKVAALRDRLINGILNEIPHADVNGGLKNRLPGNVNVAFRFIESESILNMLDLKGICASSGSACNSDSLDPSHVLLSIGVNHERANGSVRFSLGRYNTEEEIDFVVSELKPVIEWLRNMSPLYEDFVKAGKD